MQAQQSRTGGRYIAQQRGSELLRSSADEIANSPRLAVLAVDEADIFGVLARTDTAPAGLLGQPRRGMLIERLGAASLALVADMLGCGVDELQRRYSA